MAKVAVVTGSSSGLGKALCEVLHMQTESNGCKSFRVFATARNPASLTPLQEIGIEVQQLDVTDAESIQVAVESIVSQAGGIDVLICNAGINAVGPLLEQSISDIKKLYETNVFGVLQVIQSAGAHMIQQRSGLIVCIGSVTANFSTPFAGAYSSSKAAVHSLSTTLQMELAPFNVRVMIVEAGAITSQISENSVKISNLDSYDNPSSFYYKIRDMIRMRAVMSQRDPSKMSAQDTAAQIVAAIKKKYPPNKIRVAGNVLYYVFLGFIQSWIASGPLAKMMIKKFGLDRLQKSS